MESHTLNLKLFLKRDNFKGERGEVGFEVELVLGDLVALGVFLFWNLGLSFAFAASETVRQRKPGLDTAWDCCKRGVEGLLPPVRNPNRTQLLGLGLGLVPLCCLSDMVDSGSRVQKALLQPVPILFTHQKDENSAVLTTQALFPFPRNTKTLFASIPIYTFLSMFSWQDEDRGKKKFCFVLLWSHETTKERDRI